MAAGGHQRHEATAHGDGPDHRHGHGHGHSHHGHAHGAHPHGSQDHGRAFIVGIILNIGFVVVEGVFGILSNSVALLADAGHNLSDVLGLVLAYGAWLLGRRRPTARFTYGLRSSTILAALFNAILLLVACGAITLSAIQRMIAPEPVHETTVMIVAGVGIVINLGTALMFARGQAGDINIRGAFLHMMADAAVSAGVIVAGLATLLTGWLWIDPVTSLAIVAVILIGTWGLGRDSLTMALHGVPTGVDPDKVRAWLNELPGVSRVHHIHIWPMSTTQTALTAHLVMPGGHPGDVFLMRVTHDLEHDHAIAHVTLQIETGDADDCAEGC